MKRRPSDRWALAARKEAYTIRKGSTLRLYTLEDTQEPLCDVFYRWVVIRAVRHKLGQQMTFHYKMAKRKFMKENLYQPCYICNRRMSGWLKRYDGLTNAPLGNAVTIDHIIPLWVVDLLELPMLEFDRRNFGVCCAACNSKRGNELRTIGDVRKDIGDKVIDRLFEKTGKFYPDDYHHVWGYAKI